MKKILYGLIGVLVFGLFLTGPVFADCPEGTVPAALIGSGDNVMTSADGDRCFIVGDEGGGVSYILKTVIEVMSIGVGILGVLGITVVGIRYLTAGGDVGKVQKAKTRLFEIVIGVAVYVVIGSFLYFLIPDSNIDVKVNTPSKEEIIAQEKAKKEEAKKNEANENKNNQSSNNNGGSTAEQKNPKKAAAVKKLQNTVKKYTWPTFSNKNKNIWKNGNGSRTFSKDTSHPYGANTYTVGCGEQDCGSYVLAMMQLSGWDKNYDKAGSYCKIGKSNGYCWSVAGQLQYLKDKSHGWKEITSSVKKDVNNGGNGNLEPGDLVIYVGSSHRHVMLYTGKIAGFQSKFVEASHCNYTGTSAKPGRRSMSGIMNYYKNDLKNLHVFRYTGWD